MLQEYIARLRRPPWAADTQDAHTLTDMAQMRDDLRQGSDLWDPPEILHTARRAKAMAKHTDDPQGQRIIRQMAADLESYLPTPTSVAAEAEHVVELSQMGDTDQARARHLKLWTTVLDLIRHGHEDAAALAEAAHGAYDTTAETFVLDHLT